MNICPRCGGEVRAIDSDDDSDYKCSKCNWYYPICVGSYGCGGPVLEEPSRFRNEWPQSQHRYCYP